MGLLGQAKSEGDRGDWLGVRHREIPAKVVNPDLSQLCRENFFVLSGNTLEMRRVRMEEEEEEALRVIMITSVKTTGGGSWRLSGY